jgi:hypothetical protein
MSRRQFQRRQEQQDKRQARRDQKAARQGRHEDSMQGYQRLETSRRRRRIMVRVLLGLFGVLILAGVVWGIVAELFKDQPGTKIPDIGNLHIESLDAVHESYNSSPPTSGPHVPGVARPGIYEEQIPDELQVHNLEDAFVNVHYNCPNGCEALISRLTIITQEYLDAGRHVLLEPYAGMDTKIALTAWTRIDKFEEFDESRIRRFIEAYEGMDHHLGTP